MNHDKPWMQPCVYTDTTPKDSLRSDVPLDGNTDQVTKLPRAQGDRASLKPNGPGRDTTPTTYRWHTQVKNIFGLEAHDELDAEVPDPEPEAF